MSTPIDRLHRDRRGIVTSVEFALSAPLFLLMAILTWDFGMIGAAKLQLVATTRTAAWMEARHGLCVAPQVDQQAVARKTEWTPPTCDRRPWSGAAAEWRAMDAAGGQSLTGTVSRARAPDEVTATRSVTVRFHAALGFAPYTMTDRFTTMEGRTYTVADEAIARGYDPVLHDRLSTHGAFMDLFPNVFPRSRR